MEKIIKKNIIKNGTVQKKEKEIMKNVSSGKTRGSRPHHRRKKKKKSYVKFLKRKRIKTNTKGILTILKQKKNGIRAITGQIRTYY